MAEKTAKQELSDIQKAFAYYYVTESGFNATDALRRANETLATPEKYDCLRSQASYFKNHPLVQKEIARLLKKAGITQERIKCELAEIALANDIADFEELLDGSTPVSQLKANTTLIKKVKCRIMTDKDGNTTEHREIELYDRLSALEKLAKILDMYKDISVEVNVPQAEDTGSLAKAINNFTEVMKEKVTCVPGLTE